MGDLSEFSIVVQGFLRLYPWRRIDPIPWQPLRKGVSESRVAVISTAGLVQAGQQPFDKDVKGGDYSFRRIPSDSSTESLVDTHRSQSYDHSGLRADPNLVLPLDRLREMQASGEIGSIARNHISFMGSITAPGRLLRQTAPEAGLELVQDEVDLAILIPV